MLTGFFMLFDVYFMLMKILYHISLWAGSLGWDFMHVTTTICKLFCGFAYFFYFYKYKQLLYTRYSKKDSITIIQRNTKEAHKLIRGLMKSNG